MFKSIIAFTKCKKFYGGNNMNDVIRLVKKGFWYTISDFAYSDIRQSTLVDANFIFDLRANKKNTSFHLKYKHLPVIVTRTANSMLEHLGFKVVKTKFRLFGMDVFVSR